MSMKFTRRAAAELLHRGQNAIRIKQTSTEEAKKAITKDDVRRLIKEGAVYAQKDRADARKRVASDYRRRGTGSKRGTRKVREGNIWERKIRAQRRLLQRLKHMGKLDTKTFNRYYGLSKGNMFPDKRSMLLHLSDEGIKVSEEELKQINEYVRNLYK